MLVTVAGLAAALVPARAQGGVGDLYESDFSSNSIFKFTPVGAKHSHIQSVGNFGSSGREQTFALFERVSEQEFHEPLRANDKIEAIAAAQCQWF